MLLHKLLPFAIPKPAFLQLNSTNVSYADIMRRSRRELVSSSCPPVGSNLQLGCSHWVAPGAALLVHSTSQAPKTTACRKRPLQYQVVFKTILAAAAAAAVAALWRSVARPALAALGWA